jgi:hypothetical protein
MATANELTKKVREMAVHYQYGQVLPEYEGWVNGEAYSEDEDVEASLADLAQLLYDTYQAGAAAMKAQAARAMQDEFPFAAQRVRELAV